MDFQILNYLHACFLSFVGPVYMGQKMPTYLGHMPTKAETLGDQWGRDSLLDYWGFISPLSPLKKAKKKKKNWNALRSPQHGATMSFSSTY